MLLRKFLGYVNNCQLFYGAYQIIPNKLYRIINQNFILLN